MESYTAGQNREPDYVGPPLVVDIDIARKMISHAEQNTADAIAYYQTELAKAQEEIGRLKELLRHSHAFMRRLYPRLSGSEMPRMLMLAIGNELWGKGERVKR